MGLGKGKRAQTGSGLGSGASRPALLLKILPFMLLTSEKIRLKCAATQLRREKEDQTRNPHVHMIISSLGLSCRNYKILSRK